MTATTAALFTPAATDTGSVILTVVGWTNGNGWLGFKVGCIRRLGGKGGGGGGGMRKRSPTSLKIIKDLQSETTAVSDHVQSACYCVNGPAPRHNQPPL